MESEAAALVIERVSAPILHQRMKLTFERGNDGDFRHDFECSAATQTQNLKPQRTQSTQRNTGRLKLRDLCVLCGSKLSDAALYIIVLPEPFHGAHQRFIHRNMLPAKFPLCFG